MQNNFILYNTIPSLSIGIGENQDSSNLLEENIREIQKIIEDLKKIEKNRIVYSAIAGSSLVMLSLLGSLLYFSIPYFPNRNQQTEKYNQYPIINQFSNFTKTCGDYFPVKNVCKRLNNFNFNDPQNLIGVFCKHIKNNLCDDFDRRNFFPGFLIFLTLIAIILGFIRYSPICIGYDIRLVYLKNINENLRDNIITLAVKYSLTDKEPFVSVFDHLGNLVDNALYRQCKLKDIRIKFEEKLIELQNTHKRSNNEEVITIESNMEAITASDVNTNENTITTVGRFNTFGLFSAANINPLPLNENDPEQHFPSPHLQGF